MRNPLVEVVERELNQFGVSNANLVHESYNHQNFGNAEAVYEIGYVKLRFVRDRGDDMISLGSSISSQLFYIDDVAVWMGWLSLDDLLRFYRAPIDFAKPPRGPLFSLTKALGLIARDLKQLDKAFSSGELMSTHAKLKDMERNRVSAT